MPTAYTTAETLRFPARCVRCDATPDRTHEIQATRGIDLIVIAAWESLDIPVPVCAACKRHRRWRGVAIYAGAILFMIAACTSGIVLRDADHGLPGGALIALAFLPMIALRVGGSEWLELSSLGLRIDLLKGDHTPLRLTFRREAFFRAWRAVNPSATPMSKAAPSKPPVTSDASAPAQFSRRGPLFLLTISGIATFVHDLHASSSGEVYPMLVLVMSSFGALALVGCYSPAVFYAIGKYGKHLPIGYKLMAGLSWATGFALGMYALFTMY